MVASCLPILLHYPTEALSTQYCTCYVVAVSLWSMACCILEGSIFFFCSNGCILSAFLLNLWELQLYRHVLCSITGKSYILASSLYFHALKKVRFFFFFSWKTCNCSFVSEIVHNTCTQWVYWRFFDLSEASPIGGVGLLFQPSISSSFLFLYLFLLLWTLGSRVHACLLEVVECVA